MRACSPRRALEAVETRTTSSRFTETSEPFSCRCEYIVGDADKFSVMVFHAGFDHDNALANPQAAQVGPRALLLLSTEHASECEDNHKNHAEPRSHEKPPSSTDVFDKSKLLLESS